MKAIVLVVDDDASAPTVARLIGATLTMNGYDAGAPAVIDWPTHSDEDAPAPEDVPTIDAEEASGLSADALNAEACGPVG